MDLANGTLRHEIQQGRFATRSFVPIYDAVRDISNGVMALHEQKCWHRDLKPENILLAADGRYQLADFGLAHLHPDFVGLPPITSTDSILANRDYYAPETRDGRVDARADVFSAGLIVWELLTGRIPRGAPRMPSDQWPRLGSDIDVLLRRCCAYNPGERLATMKAFWRSFAAVVERTCILPTIRDTKAFRVAARSGIETIEQLTPEALNHIKVHHSDDVFANIDWYSINFWDLLPQGPMLASLLARAVQSGDRRLHALRLDAVDAVLGAAQRIMAFMTAEGHHGGAPFCLGENIFLQACDDRLKARPESSGRFRALVTNLHQNFNGWKALRYPQGFDIVNRRVCRAARSGDDGCPFQRRFWAGQSPPPSHQVVD